MVPPEEEENRAAVGLGQAIGDVVLLTVEKRNMQATIATQAKRIHELEEQQAAQQSVDAKLEYVLEEAGRVERNELITRAGWRDAEGRIQAAIAALEKHDCSPSCDGVAEKALALLRPPLEPKPIYTAIFLDDISKDALLKAFPPIHPKVFGHHVTLAFKPSPEAIKAYAPLLGHEVAVEVIGVAADDKGQAVKVQVPKPYGELWEQNHHVTISCISSPVYSNDLLKQGWKPIEKPLRLLGVVRHFTK